MTGVSWSCLFGGPLWFAAKGMRGTAVLHALAILVIGFPVGFVVMSVLGDAASLSVQARAFGIPIAALWMAPALYANDMYRRFLDKRGASDGESAE